MSNTLKRYLVPIIILMLVTIIAGCTHNDDLVGAGDILIENYDSQEYLTPEVTPTITMIVATTTPVEDEYCFVNGEGVRVRNEPNTKCTILKIVQSQTKLKVLEKDNGWTKILYELESIEGYIRDDLLSFDIPSPKATATAVLANNIDIEYAKIVVKKKDRMLELWDGDSLVDTYNIGLGWTPTGHKQQEGDGKTPEGDYYVCVKNSNSSFYLSLGISYPNKDDAKAAYDLNRINKATHDKIASAIDDVGKPPWNTPLGGEIMIHGCGGNRDWTAGCIAVDDEVMDVLFEVCEIGTPIKILP